MPDPTPAPKPVSTSPPVPSPASVSPKPAPIPPAPPPPPPKPVPPALAPTPVTPIPVPVPPVVPAPTHPVVEIRPSTRKPLSLWAVADGGAHLGLPGHAFEDISDIEMVNLLRIAMARGAHVRFVNSACPKP